MNKQFYSNTVLTILFFFLFNCACKEPLKKALPKEKDHPMLIKTIGNAGYGNVQCIMQDNSGNLWYGTTENGLYKFDGNSFQRFLKADGLGSNNIYCLLEAKNGIIWIGTEAGLCIYDPSSWNKTNEGIFKQINIPLPKDLPANKNPHYSNSHWVYDMMKAKDGKIWFATMDGIYCYTSQQNEKSAQGQAFKVEESDFTYFKLDKELNGYLSKNDVAERILEDKDGRIWFGARTNEGAYCYDGKSISKLNLPTLFQNGPKPKPHNWGWPQFQDSKGNIWFSNWGGAYRYDGKTITSYTKKDGLPGMVTKIIEDKKGNIWLGGDGLSKYDGKSFTNFGIMDGMTNPGVWSILEDNNGNLWIGTRATGLYLYDGKKIIPYSDYQPQK